MSAEAIKTYIQVLIKEIDSLTRQRYDLQRGLDRLKSLEFIRVNEITKDMVQRCDEDGMPWMGDVYTFGEWCQKNSTKKWCCWNGTICLTDELLKTNSWRTSPGRYEDLE